MSETIWIDIIVIFLFTVIFTTGLILGDQHASENDYEIYMSGVDDASEFYKFYNDTEKDIDIDFWVDFSDERYDDRYYNFKEKYMVKR